MSAAIIPLKLGAALARIAASPDGWQIDCRSPHVARLYDFHSAGDAAEFAIMLRDDGNWQLRFSADAEVVRALVTEPGR